MDYSTSPRPDIHPDDHPGPAIIIPRGRPAVPLPPYELELRITPVDGKPITPEEWLYEPTTVVGGLLGVSVWEEGGEGTDKALHYHVILRTTWSRGLVRKWACRVARDKHERGGNRVFRTGETHEHSYGYVAKHGQCITSTGDYKNVENDWKERSRQYVENLKRETERNRKQKALSRKRQLEIIREYAIERLKCGAHADSLKVGMPRDPLVAIERFVEYFLTECDKRNFDFPTKFQMEALTIRSLYRDFPEAIHRIYRANMERVFSLTDR